MSALAGGYPTSADILQQLEQAIGRCLAEEGGPGELAELHFRSAQLCLSQEQIGVSNRALAHLWEAWKLEPEDIGLRLTLAACLERAGELEQLAELHRRAAALLDDSRERTALLLAAGKAWERLGDLEQALQMLRQASDLGEHRQRQQRVETLGTLADRLRAAGMQAQEAEARRLLLRELSGPERLPCALELAALRQRLGDAAGAYAAHAEALTVAPTAAAALEPALAYLKGQGQEEAAARLMESAALAEACGAARAARWRALADHCEQQLADTSRAIRCWWRAWEEEESGKEAPNLKRLCSDGEDWQQYQRVLERETRLARSPSQKLASYRELTTFQREVLDDKPAAFASCGLILQLDPADPEALALRVSLCEEQCLHRELLAALRRQVRYQRPCPAREAAAVRLARLEAAAGRGSSLFVVLDQLDPLAKSTRALVHELQEQAWGQRQRGLAIKLGALALTLASPVEEPAGGRISFALRLAEQCKEAGEFGEAADCYRRVLELSGDHREARARLEELTQREQLLDPTAISLALRAERLAEEQPQRACSLLLRAAHVGLQAEPPAREAAGKYLRRALSLRQAGTAVALPVLEEALAAAGMDEELARLLEQEATGASTLSQRKAILQHLTELYRDRLEQPERAVQALLQLLACDPADSEVMAQLRRLYESMGQYGAVAQVLEDLLATAEGQPRVARLEELARLYADQLDEQEAAARHYHELLALQPNHRPALDFCRRHDEAAGNYRAVAVQLCRAAEAAGDALERAQLHREIAQIAEQRLGDLDFAISQWRQVVELCPADSAPRAELRRLLVQAERWRELESALLAEVSRSLRAEEKVPIYLQLADVAERRLQQVQAGAGYLRLAHQLAPQDAAILQRLEGAYEQLGSWHELAGALRRHAEIAGQAERVALLLRAAQLTLARLHREEEALAICRYLREVEPGNRASAALMGEIYERRGQWREQAGLLREQISSEVDPLEQARLHLELGRLQLQRMNDPESAARHFEQALELDAGRGEALSLLRQLYETLGRWDLLVELIRRRTAAESVSMPEKVAALYEMGRIREEHQDDLAGAREAYERAVHLDAGFRPALTALRALALARGQWREVVSLARQELQALTDAAEKAQLLLEIGQVLAEKLERPSAAIEALEEALSLDPANTRAAERLAVIYFKEEEWERAGTFLQKVVESGLELKNLHESYYRLGFANEQLGREDEAFSWYVKSFGKEPMYLPTLDRLVDLCYARHQWDNTLRIAEAILSSYESQKSSKELAELSLRIGLCELHLAQQEVASARIQALLLVEPGQKLLAPKEGLQDVAECWSAIPLERTLLLGIRPEVVSRAVKAMERVLIYAPEQPRALEVLAALACTAGDFERALRYLERAVEAFSGQRPRQAELLLFAGDLASQRLRSAQRGEAYYRTAQRLCPGQRLVSARLQLLQAAPPRGISTPPPYRGGQNLKRGELSTGALLAPAPGAPRARPGSFPPEPPSPPPRSSAQRERDTNITQPLPPLPLKPRKP